MRSIDRGIGVVIGAFKWAALVIALLLFAQWPLRDWFQAGSREANDFGQCLFALFVAASVTAATRADRHIAADSLAAGYGAATRRRLQCAGIVLGVLPWAGFVAWAGWSTVTRSVGVFERFQDTGNQGYFIIKLALLLMLAMMMLQALIDLFAPSRGPHHDRQDGGAP